jgi:AbrB family looped-hinge helix DNA binding protein
MTLKTDGSDRIVAPKTVRERFGMKEGTDLEMQEIAEGVSLKPISKRASLERAGHFLVHTGKAPAGFNVLRSIADDREERIRKLGGV